MTEIAITGANGFVGTHLREELARRGRRVRALVRSEQRSEGHTSDERVVRVDFDDPSRLARALEGADAVVHLVGHTHRRRSDEAQYRHVNVGCTRAALEAAASAGARRFLFVSSVKALGNGGADPYTDHTVPRPEDAYGRSKLEAENVVRTLGAGRGVDHVILRPPLVYGAGVKGNLHRLIAAVVRRRAIPVTRSAPNRRSLISARNLASAIVDAITWPDPIDDTYLVSDGVDVSTRELVELIARAAGVEARTIATPPVLVRVLGMMGGPRPQVEAMFGSLRVDSSRFAQRFGWSPPQTLEQGLREAGDSVRGRSASSHQ